MLAVFIVLVLTVAAEESAWKLPRTLLQPGDPFDCRVGLETWWSDWDEPKMKWCCTNRVRCPEVPSSVLHTISVAPLRQNQEQQAQVAAWRSSSPAAKATLEFLHDGRYKSRDGEFEGSWWTEGYEKLILRFNGGDRLYVTDDRGRSFRSADQTATITPNDPHLWWRLLYKAPDSTRPPQSQHTNPPTVSPSTTRQHVVEVVMPPAPPPPQATTLPPTSSTLHPDLVPWRPDTVRLPGYQGVPHHSGSAGLPQVSVVVHSSDDDGVDCSDGLAAWWEWPQAKQRYCCHEGRARCAPHVWDCVGDVAEWSSAKTRFCCENKGVGCHNMRPEDNIDEDVSGVENGGADRVYDCDIRPDNPYRSWDEIAKEWCCAEKNVACQDTLEPIAVPGGMSGQSTPSSVAQPSLPVHPSRPGYATTVPSDWPFHGPVNTFRGDSYHGTQQVVVPSVGLAQQLHNEFVFGRPRSSAAQVVLLACAVVCVAAWAAVLRRRSRAAAGAEIMLSEEETVEHHLM